MHDQHTAYPAIKDLANQIKELWRHENFEYGCFPDIAVNALSQFKLCHEINAINIADWVLNSTLPQQLQNESDDLFGDPPVTLYSDELFVIDVYFWLSRNTTIHDHAFSGAFCVLDGSILQISYLFEEYSNNADLIDTNIKMGKLLPKSIAVLNDPSKIVKIIPGRDFIHSTTHLTVPTTTLCIRTKKTPGYVQSYYIYPSFALTGPNKLSHNLQFKMLKLLTNVSSNQAKEYLAQLGQKLNMRSLIDIISIFIRENDFDSLNALLQSISIDDFAHREAINELIEMLLHAQNNIHDIRATHVDSVITAEILKLNIGFEATLKLIELAFPEKKSVDILYQWLTISGQENVLSNNYLMSMMKSCHDYFNHKEYKEIC